VYRDIGERLREIQADIGELHNGVSHLFLLASKPGTKAVSDKLAHKADELALLQAPVLEADLAVVDGLCAKLIALVPPAEAAPLISEKTPPPDAGPAFRSLPVRASFDLAPHAPPLQPLFEPVFQIPPAPEPKRMPAPQPPQRTAQDEESNLAEMAQRLKAALQRPDKPVEPRRSRLG
jgi:hypothetical protein